MASSDFVSSGIPRGKTAKCGAQHRTLLWKQTAKHEIGGKEECQLGFKTGGKHRIQILYAKLESDTQTDAKAEATCEANLEAKWEAMREAKPGQHAAEM